MVEKEIENCLERRVYTLANVITILNCIVANQDIFHGKERVTA